MESLLQSLSYGRPRGNIQTSPSTKHLKSRMRCFLVEVNDSSAQEGEKSRAIIVYMEGIFVHQLHSSAYPYMQRDKEVVVHDGSVAH